MDTNENEFDTMTKSEALAYLGLDDTATPYMIDDKFWQLSKRYRLDTSEDGKKKVADLSLVYDIATGKRDAERKASEVRAAAKKYLGKTSDEWVNYFQYTWYKYLIAIVAVLAFGNLFYQIFLAPKVDSCIVSLGHFYVEDAYMDAFLKEMDFKNPYCGSVNIVVPNDQNQTSEPYSEISATTQFLSEPNVVISDEQTIRYYYDNCADLAYFYSRLKSELTEAQLANLTPLYCSEADYHSLLREYEEKLQLPSSEDDEASASYSDRPILIGLELKDSDIISSMGYKTLWPDDEPNLVFSIYNQSMNYNNSEEILIGLFKKIL